MNNPYTDYCDAKIGNAKNPKRMSSGFMQSRRPASVASGKHSSRLSNCKPNNQTTILANSHYNSITIGSRMTSAELKDAI